jgi:putative copper export protein/methionine-rich copper-binding protein CopC
MLRAMLRWGVSFSPAARRALAVVLVGQLALPRAAAAHVRLESSAPARDEVLATSPPRLRLRFTAHIEQRYTQVTLAGPDQRPVPLGTVTFVSGSDREFYVDVPPLAESGAYTVAWRTAGADGHPLEGSFQFTLDLPPARDSTVVPRTDTAGVPGIEHGGHMAGGEPENAAGRPASVLGRGAHFIALTLLLGALACRLLLLPRLRLEEPVARELRRRVWRGAAFAALALVAATVFRLWVQSVALHGAAAAWDVPLLTMMLTDTSWGRVWVFQVVLLGVFAVALAAARPASDRIALVIAVPAALGLAAVPALSGHAAGAERGLVLAVVNDVLHVCAGGAWLGTLAMIGIGVVPGLTRVEVAPDRAVAEVVDRFSPLALSMAAVLVASGVVNSLLHFGAVGELITTVYGRTLLIKLALFTGVLAAGAYNWQRLRPRLGGRGSAMWLRRSLAIELGFALAVFGATAYLTGLPRPG